MGPVSFLALFALAPLGLAAQRSATLGAGTGVVRYPGGSSFSPLTVSPTVQQFSPSSYIGLGGSLSLLDDGEWAAQARADIWGVIARRRARTQLAMSGTFAASTRTDGVGAGSALALVEVVRDNYAGGAGAVTGLIEGLSGDCARAGGGNLASRPHSCRSRSRATGFSAPGTRTSSAVPISIRTGSSRRYG
jgi:hypothetical protein